VDHHALLLINPHTSFFFRSELQMSSDTGLNVYGAATWGQFFIYQGFNAQAGWMLTSSGVDNVDRFAETIVPQGGKLFYRYGAALRPVGVDTVTLSYKNAGGALAQRSFAVYRTHHGPVIAATGGKWISMAADEQTNGRAGAVFSAHQGNRLRVLLDRCGAASQFFKRHDLCRYQRRDRVFASAIHPQAG
jgi:acyl-homoserine lactone acylase PvdQ